MRQKNAVVIVLVTLCLASISFGEQTVVTSYVAGVAAGTQGTAADPTSQGWTYQSADLAGGGIYTYDSSAKPDDGNFPVSGRGGWTTTDGTGYGYGYYRFNLDESALTTMSAGWKLDVTFALDSSRYLPGDGSVSVNYFKSGESGGGNGSIDGTRIGIVTPNYKYMIRMSRSGGNYLWIYDGTESWGMGVLAFDAFHQLSLVYDGQNVSLKFGAATYVLHPVSEIKIWDRDGETPSYETSNCIFFGEASAYYHGSATWNKITLEKAANAPIITSQNRAFNVPSIASIVVDGNISDWISSTEWSDPFIYWIGSMSSTTRAKFAWNDAKNMLYVAIETNELANLPGGHPVVGIGTSLDQAAIYGVGATQLAFETIAGGNSVDIVNEIHKYKILDPGNTGSYVDSGTVGVQAAYSYNGSIWTYEIAIPLWTNWAIDQMMTKKSLAPGNEIYLYAMMQNIFNGNHGTNMTYLGNPGFAGPGGLAKGTVLTLMGPVAIAGDANGDNMVDVGDLGILAANYGSSGKTWEQGDFNNDGLVDVGDLGILAAHYGEGSTQQSNFSADYAKAFGTTVAEDDSNEEMSSSICSGLGLPLMVGLFLAGLLLGVTKQEA